MPEGIFKNLVSLEELGLEWNHIESIPKEFFRDLVCLKRLWLEGNKIETEDSDSFDADVIDLRANVPEHIQIDESYNDDSDDQDSTDE